MNFQLKSYQEQPCIKAHQLLEQGKSFLLLGKTGCGKTYIMTALASMINESREEVDDLTLELMGGDSYPQGKLRFLAITPKPVRTQFRRVAVQAGVYPTTMDVITDSELRSSVGHRYVKWDEELLDDGTPIVTPHWHVERASHVIILDECQIAKNDETLLATILKAYLLETNGCIVFTSATPFYKLAETKLLCLALLGWSYAEHSERMAQVVGPYIDQTKASEEGSKRFAEYLKSKGLLIDVEGVKYDHRAFTRNKLLVLDTDQKVIYEQAFNEWLEKRAALELEPYGSAWAEEQAARIKFEQVAEMLRVKQLANDATHWVRCEGKQVIVGLKYKESLEVLIELLERKGLMQGKELAVLVGGQKESTRQKEIDRFQAGDALVLAMTQATGKVGLSLDHDGTSPRQKPRVVLLSCVWSPIDMIQILGRAHRANTQSTTYQYLYWFKDTVEESVAAVCSNGVKAISKLSKERFDWIRIYEKGASKREAIEAQVEMELGEAEELLDKLDSSEQQD